MGPGSSPSGSASPAPPSGFTASSDLVLAQNASTGQVAFLDPLTGAWTVEQPLFGFVPDPSAPGPLTYVNPVSGQQLQYYGYDTWVDPHDHRPPVFHYDPKSGRTAWFNPATGQWQVPTPPPGYWADLSQPPSRTGFFYVDAKGHTIVYDVRTGGWFDWDAYKPLNVSTVERPGTGDAAGRVTLPAGPTPTPGPETIAHDSAYSSRLMALTRGDQSVPTGRPASAYEKDVQNLEESIALRDQMVREGATAAEIAIVDGHIARTQKYISFWDDHYDEAGKFVHGGSTAVDDAAQEDDLEGNLELDATIGEMAGDTGASGAIEAATTHIQTIGAGGGGSQTVVPRARTTKQYMTQRGIEPRAPRPGRAVQPLKSRPGQAKTYLGGKGIPQLAPRPGRGGAASPEPAAPAGTKTRPELEAEHQAVIQRIDERANEINPRIRRLNALNEEASKLSAQRQRLPGDPSYDSDRAITDGRLREIESERGPLRAEVERLQAEDLKDTQQAIDLNRQINPSPPGPPATSTGPGMTKQELDASLREGFRRDGAVAGDTQEYTEPMQRAPAATPDGGTQTPPPVVAPNQTLGVPGTVTQPLPPAVAPNPPLGVPGTVTQPLPQADGSAGGSTGAGDASSGQAAVAPVSFDTPSAAGPFGGLAFLARGFAGVGRPMGFLVATGAIVLGTFGGANLLATPAHVIQVPGIGPAVTLPPVTGPLTITPIAATLAADGQSTTYQVTVSNVLGFQSTSWSVTAPAGAPDCNHLTMASGAATWHHGAADGCGSFAGSSASIPGMVTVRVADGSGFRCTATYSGSLAGTGPPASCQGGGPTLAPNEGQGGTTSLPSSTLVSQTIPASPSTPGAILGGLLGALFGIGLTGLFLPGGGPRRDAAPDSTRSGLLATSAPSVDTPASPRPIMPVGGPKKKRSCQLELDAMNRADRALQRARAAARAADAALSSAQEALAAAETAKDMADRQLDAVQHPTPGLPGPRVQEGGTLRQIVRRTDNAGNPIAPTADDVKNVDNAFSHAMTVGEAQRADDQAAADLAQAQATFASARAAAKAADAAVDSAVKSYEDAREAYGKCLQLQREGL